AAGTTAPALVVDRTIGQVQRLLGTDPEDSPGMAPLPERAAERELVAGILRDRVWPAFEGYLSLLNEYRPQARDTVGLCALPGGDAMYASQIRAHTTLPLDAATVHETGRRELARVQDEARATAARLGHPDAGSALAKHSASGRNTAG